MTKHYVLDYCELDSKEQKEAYLEEFIAVYSLETNEEINNMNAFLKKWHSNKLAGKKFTVVLMDEVRSKSIGAVRLWSSPYCNNKWLIESLEVKNEYRNKGYAKILIAHGLKLLKSIGVIEIYANISKKNIASMATHKSMGFDLYSDGTFNSFGMWRDNSCQMKLKLDV